MKELDELRGIVARLRAPGGCPWDREQTHATLRTSVVEEAYEVVEAIDKADDLHLREELGDLLLQVLMHSQIADEEGRFTLEDVARGISEKLVRRHPHVFGENKLADTAAVLKQWDEIKREEKGATASTSILDGVSSALPALMRAEKVQKRAARVGFDWPVWRDVLAKVREELEEIERATPDEMEEEIGDLLFCVTNVSRKAGFDPELTLHAATSKFMRRFQAMEKEFAARGQSLDLAPFHELDAAWDEVKRVERSHV